MLAAIGTLGLEPRAARSTVAFPAKRDWFRLVFGNGCRGTLLGADLYGFLSPLY